MASEGAHPGIRSIIIPCASASPRFLFHVGIKLLRTFGRQDDRGVERAGACPLPDVVFINVTVELQRLNREIAIWRRMRHSNIAAFYGVSYEHKGRAGLIMEWYRNGMTPAHIARQRGMADIHGMVRQALSFASRMLYT